MTLVVQAAKIILDHPLHAYLVILQHLILLKYQDNYMELAQLIVKVFYFENYYKIYFFNTICNNNNKIYKIK